MSIVPTPTWQRVVKIVASFAILGPLVFSVILMLEIVVFSFVWTHYPWPLLWRTLVQAVLVTCAFGAPYALVTGGLFAMLAVLLGWRKIWVALAVALILICFVGALPIIGLAVWRLPTILVASGAIPLTIAVAACWHLSRRWHA